MSAFFIRFFRSSRPRINTLCLGWLFSLVLAAAPLPVLAWQELGNGLDRDVYAIAIDTDNNVYAGGQFTKAGETNANRVAKWNGSVWSNLGSGMNTGIVFALTYTGGNLYAGGQFTTAGGTNANRIAKWDGVAWSTLDTGLNNAVRVLGADGGNLYTGGGFTTASGLLARKIAKWNGSAWSAVGNGVYDGLVNALAFDTSGNLYAGGQFTATGGSIADYIAKWNGSAWSALNIGMDYTVNALTFNAASNTLYAGGYFTTAGGVTANYIAKWNGNVWSTLGTGMDGPVMALTLDASGNLYAGGAFITAGGVTVNRVAKWDGNAWSGLGAGLGLSGTVHAMSFDTSGNLYVAGGFLNAGMLLSANYFVVHVSQDLTANQWRMVSLPHVPLSAATLQDTSMFGDNLTPSSYGSTWVVYERNETTKAYRKLAITDPLVQGKAYWIQSTSDAILDMDGTATPVVTSNPRCTSSKGCYEVTLTSPVNGEASRFNMVGFPFFRPTTWDKVRFEVDGATAYAPSDAEASNVNIAAKTLWKYSGAAYQTFDDVALTGTLGTLSKMEGFWVKLLPGSVGKTVKLLIPLT